MKRTSHILWFSVFYVLLLAGTSYPGPVAPPVISKAFGAASVPLNGSTSLSFTIRNINTTDTLTGIGFTDTLPAGLTVASSSASVCGGTLTTTAPTGIALLGASIAISGQCEFNVTVTGAVLGNYTNTTDNVTSSNGGTGNAATANLTVANPFSLEINGSRFIPALTSMGNVTMSGAVSVTNPSVMTTSADFTGSTICSGGSVILNGLAAATKVLSADGSGLIISSDMNHIRGDIIQNAPITASGLFGIFFCQPKAQIKANFFIYPTVANINGVSGQAIWYDDSLIYNGNLNVSIGSPSNPVVLVVDGNLTFNGSGNVTIYGFVYVTGALFVNGPVNLQIIGASAVEGTAVSNGALGEIVYDSGVLTKASYLTPLCIAPIGPSITSGNSTDFTIGSAGSFTVTTTGNPAPTINSSGNLPGGVTFTDNANGTATLDGTPTAGTAGIYPLTFMASNGVLSDATQNFTLTVAQAGSTTSLNSSLNPSIFGQTVTFDATVSGGAGTPTGTVTFTEGATTHCSLVSLNGSGQATCSISSLTAGTHTIAATYSGDGNYNGSSGTVDQTVYYAVSFESGGNGTVNGTTSQMLSPGSSTTEVSAVPADGYYFVNWTGTGGFVTTAANPLTVSNVTANMTITANFAVIAVVTSIIPDPATPGRVITGNDGYGVYIGTTSGGVITWAPATTQPTNLRIKLLVINLTTGSTLFAATYGGGVFRSTDSGDNWAVCKDGSGVENGGLTNLNVVSMGIDASGKLYAGTEGGIFASSDGCVSWNDKSTDLPNPASNPPVVIVIDPVTPTTLYAGLDDGGVYKSINSGGTWNVATTPPTNTRVKALVIKPGNSTKLYAATYGGGVFKSINNSGDPANNGMDWGACGNTDLTNLNVVSLTIDANGKLYAGTEAGVFTSSDNCDNWTEMNNGLPN